MYVTSQGVTKRNQRQAQQSDPWDKPKGHMASTPRSVSRIEQLAHRANSTLGAIMVGCLIVTLSLAIAINNRADASRPNIAIRNFGAAQELGVPSVPSRDDAVAITSAKTIQGYWIATKRGEVHPFGEAADLGSLPDGEVTDVVDIRSTSTGQGYWLITQTGNVYTFGDAQFHGSVENTAADIKFVSIIPTPSGDGYVLVDDVGNVVVFGQATNYGKAGMLQDGDKIVDASLSHDGKGYLMVTERGAVFAFGDAKFYGAARPGLLSASASAISPNLNGRGYWILAQDGGIFTFGDATFHGSAVQQSSVQDLPSIGLAIYGDGEGYWIAKGKTPTKPVKTQVLGANIERGNVEGPNIDANSDNADVWAKLRQCEAGGNYQANTGNGYYGAYQFHKRTWESMNTGYAYAHLAPPEVQDDAAKRLQARSGWGQWPACSRKIGVR